MALRFSRCIEDRDRPDPRIEDVARSPIGGEEGLLGFGADRNSTSFLEACAVDERDAVREEVCYANQVGLGKRDRDRLCMVEQGTLGLDIFGRQANADHHSNLMELRRHSRAAGVFTNGQCHSDRVGEAG